MYFFVVVLYYQMYYRHSTYGNEDSWNEYLLSLR
jgi:hypothetical protein